MTHHLEKSANLSQKMLSQLDLEALCQIIGEHLVELVGCQSVGCMFFDADM